jgi:hypothetical protein
MVKKRNNEKISPEHDNGRETERETGAPVQSEVRAADLHHTRQPAFEQRQQASLESTTLCDRIHWLAVGELSKQCCPEVGRAG